MTSMETFWKDICLSLTQRTAQIIERNQVELSNIKWADGEANTDSGFSKLGCSSCEEAWGQIKVDYPNYLELSIKCSSPDITITFLKDSKPVVSSKIELKSGKGKGLIPGSTIGNLDINEPVIFCLRNESSHTFQIRYSQYHNCIGESNTDMFQDRTPRPYVNFQKMTDVNTRVEYKHKEKNDWVEHYALCALFRTKNSKPYKSWQDNLTAAIIRNFIKETGIEEFAKLKAELN
jgi:hypothetical protein